jgi:hypothetical protein
VKKVAAGAESNGKQEMKIEWKMGSGEWRIEARRAIQQLRFDFTEPKATHLKRTRKTGFRACFHFPFSTFHFPFSLEIGPKGE